MNDTFAAIHEHAGKVWLRGRLAEERLMRADLVAQMRAAIQAVPFSEAGDADFDGMAEAAVAVVEDFARKRLRVEETMN